MRRAFVAVVFVALIAVAPVRAQERLADVSAADRSAIEAVISRQIEAFRHDDGAAAFGFASPDIQGMFLTPERFMAMVRGGYQPVYRPREYHFARLAYVSDMLVQFVAIIGPDGTPVVAAYHMEQQQDGSWRIAGCELLTLPAEST
jgi:hypothetical protein